MSVSINTSLIQPNNVYWITGGLGGLGEIFAKHFSRIQGITLVLSGRSSLDHNKELKLSKLRESNAKVEYFVCDVSNKESVENVINHIKKHHGKINGIVHSAGMTQDAFIINKTSEQIKNVFDAKIAGVLAIDEATKNEKLDFLVLFSSIAAVIGNAGQADYAAANSFLDAFSENRNKQVQKGIRYGRSLSIAWPLWREGGMHIDEAHEALLFKTFGMQPMSTKIGLNTFDYLLENNNNHNRHQFLVAQGDVQKLSENFKNLDVKQEKSIKDNETKVSLPKQKVSKNIADILSKVTKIEPEEESFTTDFSNQGVDSMLSAEFTRELESYYSIKLSPAVIYEHKNISSLSEYLINKYPDKIDLKLDTKNDNSNFLNYVIKDTLALFCKTLKVKEEDVSIFEEFGSLGLDSMLSSEFLNSLKKFYSFDLSPTVFYEKNNINDLSEYIFNNYNEKLTLLYSNNEKENNDLNFDSLKKDNRKLLDVKSNISYRSSKNVSSRINNKKLERKKVSNKEPVAIVGRHGYFSSAKNLDDFWQHIVNGDDLVKEVPEKRWNWKDFSSGSARWGSFIDHIDKFDPEFFSLSEQEAALMSPHQRLLLQSVWSAIENSGYAPSSLSGKDIAFFVGACPNEYLELITKHLTAEDIANIHVTTGAAQSILANRISYLLNITGPSETIDTACSSSSAAIDRAVKGIQHGDYDCAIAAGVNLTLTPSGALALNQGGMISRHGRCMTFDERADGYVRSEAVGTVILKSLSRAEADGDHIYGLIRATGVNHGGRANALTAPNPDAQIALLQRTYQYAGIDIDTVNYMEVHGTGTNIGDSLEVNVLKRLYGESSEVVEPRCALGTVKTTIGHCEAASGIAGLLHVLLSLEHHTLPGNIHLEKPNAYLDLDESPFHLQKQLTAWPQIQNRSGKLLPRRAGINSFGFGGTNSHIIVEEYTQELPLESDTILIQKSVDKHIIPLSAKTIGTLRSIAKQLAEHLIRHNIIDITAVAYTLQTGRDAMPERTVFVVTNIEDLISQLNQYYASEALPENVQYDEHTQKWLQGYDIVWKKSPLEKPKRIPLPSYPFEEKYCWFDKLEKNTSSSFEDNDVLSFTTYTKPKTNLEKTLATIWSEVLNHNQIGLHDDFFTLGGNSLCAIEVVSRAKKENILLSPSDIFEYKTISKLASISLIDKPDISFRKKSNFLIDQIVELENNPNPNWMNISFLLEPYNRINKEALEKSINHVSSHHEGLRSKFSKKNNTWEVSINEDNKVTVDYIDLKSIPNLILENKLLYLSNNIQKTLNINSGKNIRIVVFDLGESRGERVLFTINHLLVDGISMNVFMNDFLSAYQNLSDSLPIKPRNKTTSVKKWSECLYEYANSKTIEKDIEYWKSLPWDKCLPLPIDYAEDLGGDTKKDLNVFSSSLTSEETSYLMNDVQNMTGLSIYDISLALFFETVSHWSHSDYVSMHSMHHGRNILPDMENIDLSRTIGFFAFVSRFLFKKPASSSLIQSVIDIKKQRESIPNDGLSLSLLSKLSDNDSIKNYINKIPDPELYFNFLGYQKNISNNKFFKFAPKSEWSNIKSWNPDGKRQFNLYCAVLIEGKNLVVTWEYSRYRNTESTIKNLSQKMIENFRSIISECKKNSEEESSLDKVTL